MNVEVRNLVEEAVLKTRVAIEVLQQTYKEERTKVITPERRQCLAQLQENIFTLQDALKIYESLLNPRETDLPPQNWAEIEVLKGKAKQMQTGYNGLKLAADAMDRILHQ
jgi:hypothetical protein